MGIISWGGGVVAVGVVHACARSLQLPELFLACCSGQAMADLGGDDPPFVVLIVLNGHSELLYLLSDIWSVGMYTRAVRCKDADGNVL